MPAKTASKPARVSAKAIPAQTVLHNRIIGMGLGLIAAAMYAAIALHYSHGF